MRKFFKYVFTAIIVTTIIGVVVTVLGGFGIKWAEEKGYYDNPVETVDGVINTSKNFFLKIAEAVTSLPFYWGLSVLASFALGLGLALLFIRLEDKKANENESLPVANLTESQKALKLCREYKNLTQFFSDTGRNNSVEHTQTVTSETEILCADLASYGFDMRRINEGERIKDKVKYIRTSIAAKLRRRPR